MANVLNYLQPFGVGAVTSGSSLQNQYAYSGTSGDQGHGWQGAFSWTNTQYTANKQFIVIPSNARDVSITYWYNGAATVTDALVASNDIPQNVASAVFGGYPTSVTPANIVGGAAGSTAVTATLPGAPLMITFTLGGSGSAGADVIGCTVSCNTIIRP
jgi:hypothetical protein